MWGFRLSLVSAGRDPAGLCALGRRRECDKSALQNRLTCAEQPVRYLIQSLFGSRQPEQGIVDAPKGLLIRLARGM